MELEMTNGNEMIGERASSPPPSPVSFKVLPGLLKQATPAAHFARDVNTERARCKFSVYQRPQSGREEKFAEIHRSSATHFLDMSSVQDDAQGYNWRASEAAVAVSQG